MEKEKLESMLIDYIDGKLNSVDQHHIEQELMRNPASYKLYEELKEVIQVMGKVSPVTPSSRMTSSFAERLKGEIAHTDAKKTVSFRPWWYGIAAAIALVITGVSIGVFVTRYNQNQEELARLREEKARTEQLVSRLTTNDSPAQRILAVSAANDDATMNTEILNALIKTMNEDPNSNVRMAAIDALKKFSSEPVVRKALISSLTQQTDPVVQIQLIQLMVDLKEKGAVKPLQKMTEDEGLLEAVKDEAHMGILVLS